MGREITSFCDGCGQEVSNGRIGLSDQAQGYGSRELRPGIVIGRVPVILQRAEGVSKLFDPVAKIAEPRFIQLSICSAVLQGAVGSKPNVGIAVRLRITDQPVRVVLRQSMEHGVVSHADGFVELRRSGCGI